MPLTQGVDVWVVFLDEAGLQLRNVEVHRNEVVRQMPIHRTPVARIEDCPFHQGHSNATDHPAGALARGKARVHDSTRRVCADHPADADRTHVGVDRDLSEDGSEGIHREPRRRSTIGRERCLRLD